MGIRSAAGIAFRDLAPPGSGRIAVLFMLAALIALHLVLTMRFGAGAASKAVVLLAMACDFACIAPDVPSGRNGETS